MPKKDIIPNHPSRVSTHRTLHPTGTAPRYSCCLHSAITMADSTPATAVTGTLEEKNNNGDRDEIRRAGGAHSPLHDASRGLLPEAAEEEEEGSARPRGHSNSDSDSSAVDSDEEEVCAFSARLVHFLFIFGGYVTGPTV